MDAIAAAAVGGAVSSLVAGFLAYRQGKANGRAEAERKFEERLRRVELRLRRMRRRPPTGKGDTTPS